MIAVVMLRDLTCLTLTCWNSFISKLGEKDSVTTINCFNEREKVRYSIMYELDNV